MGQSRPGVLAEWFLLLALLLVGASSLSEEWLLACLLIGDRWTSSPEIGVVSRSFFVSRSFSVARAAPLEAALSDRARI